MASESGDLSGKVALVTGGSRGIGRAIALELAGRGADIAFNYFRNHKAAHEAEEAISALGVRCLRVRAHLGDSDAIDGLFEKVSAEYGRLDILVNNAASGVMRPASELEEREKIPFRPRRVRQRRIGRRPSGAPNFQANTATVPKTIATTIMLRTVWYGQ